MWLNPRGLNCSNELALPWLSSKEKVVAFLVTLITLLWFNDIYYIATDKINSQTSKNRPIFGKSNALQFPIIRFPNKSIQPTKAISCLFCRKISHRDLQCPMPPTDRVDVILKEKQCTLWHWAREWQAKPCVNSKKEVFGWMPKKIFCG